MGAQEDLGGFTKGDAHRDRLFEVHLLGRDLIVIGSDFGTVRAGPRPKLCDSKLGPRITIGFPGSLDVPGTSHSETRTGLALPRTVKGFPESFSVPRTRPTVPDHYRFRERGLFATITCK